MSDRSLSPIQQAIIDRLQQGECCKGDLFSAAGVRSYSELDPELNELIQQGAGCVSIFRSSQPEPIAYRSHATPSPRGCKLPNK